MTKTYTFRANAGALIIRGHKVLIFERIDRPGEWQLPQGGIDVGETPVQTAFRELYEETGLHSTDVRLIAEHPEWLPYQYPPEVISRGNHLGQIQRWFVFEMLADDSAITLTVDHHQEFTAYKWVDANELTQITSDFKRPVYQKLYEFLQTIEREAR